MRMILLWGLLVVNACGGSRGFCEAAADCDLQIFGQAIDEAGDTKDDVAVCTAVQDGQISALRANDEIECQIVADAQEVYFACVAEEFDGGQDGCEAKTECDNELEDVQRALQDISGDECTSSET